MHTGLLFWLACSHLHNTCIQEKKKRKDGFSLFWPLSFVWSPWTCQTFIQIYGIFLFFSRGKRTNYFDQDIRAAIKRWTWIKQWFIKSRENRTLIFSLSQGQTNPVSWRQFIIPPSGTFLIWITETVQTRNFVAAAFLSVLLVFSFFYFDAFSGWVEILSCCCKMLSRKRCL